MKKMKDIQNLSDKRKIDIDKVGVNGLKYPIVLEDRKQGKQNTVATINMYVELPHHYRGTHMSRFVEILNNYHEETIVDNIENLLTEMKEKLKANVSYIELKFPYFIKKKAPISGQESLMSYNCQFDAHLEKKFVFEMAVTVPVLTLCPCSKEISESGAHNQRTYVTAKITFDEFIWLEELIEIIEKSGSAEVYSLLKREDEKFLTEKSYQNPKFVEDVVREIAKKLKNNNKITSYKVEAESIESIHNHNAYAMVKG
ncbi:MAG: GTP cyclohydrolase I FolE2 [Candidatus Cloacimonetes bacterium]|nr:GTP cyclohydrolase I FolE2 [Candidatus Cloacimonadota bacterium]